MNIRLHVLKSIRTGLPARFDVQAETPGVKFLADDQEFIEFADLGYNSRLGYYRLSAFPGVQSECENDNPETIHVLAESGDFPDDCMYVWRDADGDLHMLGELHEVADLYLALADLLMNFRCHPDPISEHDPAWNRNIDIARAVEEAVAFGLDGNSTSIAARIRAAAARGSIRGATQVDGKWSIPPLTLRGWLVRTRDEKRGRPRSNGDD